LAVAGFGRPKEAPKEREAVGAMGASACSHVGFGGVIIAGAVRPIATRALTSTLDALKCGQTCLRVRDSKSSSHECFMKARAVITPALTRSGAKCVRSFSASM
jgi:hypothetical protein